MPEIRAVHDEERAGDSRIMSSAPKVCRKCGAEIFADAPEGLCTACLFETGLGLLTRSAVATVVDPGLAEQLARDEATGAPPVKIAAHADELLGELGDYELLEVVGRGGQGVVFRARQKSLNRIVALKVISLGQWASTAHLKRFRLEAEAAARLEHPGIVPIHEVGEREGSCYFSMKFVEGGQLDQVARRQPIPPRRAVELIAKVSRTVHYAHEHGILHRDIKPGNILLDAKGEPHLTDFGLARLVESESSVTHTLDVLGTPSYMAPEQAAGNNAAVGSVTDVYGLGAVLYQLLTGHPPFAGGTTYETIKLVLDTEPRQPRQLNPKIDRDLSTICLKSLEKDPKRRYPSALALAEDLERWLKHEPIRARHTGIFARGRKWVQRNPARALSAGSLVALAAASGWIIWKSELIRQPLTNGIAVLPFENLNDQKENSVFADGVQDDILSKLAKIGDLKVISRSSVMEYRGKRNLRQIGDALRVSHVLEGSVRRAGTHLHLNAQLIDTRTDTHVWVEQYDRDLNDLFAIQSEIVQKVAEHVHAKLSATEKASIEERPTQDLIAYDFYARAVSMVYNVQVRPVDAPAEKSLSEAVDLLNKAVARDPNFLLAYCQLAFAHDLVYADEIDHTPARLALAQSAIDSAFRLRPDSGEAHLALGWHLQYSEYDRARAELALAQQSLPNDPRVYELAGKIDRRQGRWADATHNLQRASELDPRNLPYLLNLAATYNLWLHDYEQYAKVMDRILALHPDDKPTRIWRAFIEVDQRADTGPWRVAIEKILAEDPASAKDPFLTGHRFTLALLDRDFDAAGDLAAALSPKDSEVAVYPDFGRDFWMGVVARLKGDETSSRAALMRARAEQEQEIRDPDDVWLLSYLGLIDALLGKKEQALSEGRRAIEMLPIVKNLTTDGYVKRYFAMICAWAGERELALEHLEAVARIPGGPSYGDLRLNPMWDPLRAEPRFEKIVNSLAPR
jgi:serine/threonine protein kinase/tetratricopeptide (TPR) repeat protein